MHRLRGLILVLVLSFACTSPEERSIEEPLLPSETFQWCDQALTFQPPPERWRRDKHNEGGLRGVWFTHSGSVGERIYVSEYYKVGERSRREKPWEPYKIRDVVEEVRFSTEGWPIPADSFLVSEMRPDTVAGVPAYSLDFILNTPERSLVGREYYFLKNNYLFEAAYLGLPENTSLFERVVDTISFPKMDTP